MMRYVPINSSYLEYLSKLINITLYSYLLQLLETAQLLSSHFTKERLAYGIYGLYPKYRTYMEPLSSLVQMISYTVIASSLKNSKGTVSQQSKRPLIYRLLFVP
jgi:hypothetical protein